MQPADGQDPIIAQATDPRDFSTGGPTNIHAQISQRDTTTAGEYFFSPSIPALTQLSS